MDKQTEPTFKETVKNIFSYDRSDLKNILLSPITAPINAFRMGKDVFADVFASDEEGTIPAYRTSRRFLGSLVTLGGYGIILSEISPIAYEASLADLIVTFGSYFTGHLYTIPRVKVFVDSRVVSPIKKLFERRNEPVSRAAYKPHKIRFKLGSLESDYSNGSIARHSNG